MSSSNPGEGLGEGRTEVGRDTATCLQGRSQSMCKYSANSAGLFSGIANEYSKYPYVAIVIVSLLEMLYVYAVYPPVRGLPLFFVCSEPQPFPCTEVVSSFLFFSHNVFCVTSDLQKGRQELKCLNTGEAGC